MDPRKLLVCDLRQELKRRQLNSAGIKSVLVSRLQSALEHEKKAEYIRLTTAVPATIGNNFRPMSERIILRSDVPVVVDNNNESVEIVSNESIPVVSNEIVVNQENEIVIQSNQIESSSDNDQNAADGTDEINDSYFDSNEATQSNPEQTNPIVPLSIEDNTVVSTEEQQIGTFDDTTENENAVANHNKDTAAPLFEKMPGKHSGTYVYYVPAEAQFYTKKRKLLDGTITANCSHKGCNKRVFINESTGAFKRDNPDSSHQHSPKKAEYEKRKVVNALKKECSNIDVVSACDRKTSIIKSIFNSEVEK